jgi:hypothetical protein
MSPGSIEVSLRTGRGVLAAVADLHDAGDLALACTTVITTSGRLRAGSGFTAADADALSDKALHEHPALLEAAVDALTREAIRDPRHEPREAAVEAFTRSTVDELVAVAPRLGPFVSPSERARLTAGIDQRATMLRNGEVDMLVVLAVIQEHTFGGYDRG